MVHEYEDIYRPGKAELKYEPELLKPIVHIQDPDPRWLDFCGVDSSGNIVRMTLEHYAKPIEEIKLLDTVPEKVKVHFETARNLALYAWFVYRFVPVAELYACISVEFALKERTGKKWAFRKLLEHAMAQGWLKNEKFSQWQRVTKNREQRYAEEIEWSRHIERPEPESPEYWDYLSLLVEHIPWFRNQYAHGSSSISPWPYRTLEDCAEIINQVYETASTAREA